MELADGLLEGFRRPVEIKSKTLCCSSVFCSNHDYVYSMGVQGTTSRSTEGTQRVVILGELVSHVNVWRHLDQCHGSLLQSACRGRPLSL